MAMEFRKRLQSRIGTSLPATLAFDYPTVNAVAEFLAQMVFAPAAALQPAIDEAPHDGKGPVQPVAASNDEWSELDQLSEAELEALLDAELSLVG